MDIKILPRLIRHAEGPPYASRKLCQTNRRSPRNGNGKGCAERRTLPNGIADHIVTQPDFEAASERSGQHQDHRKVRDNSQFGSGMSMSAGIRCFGIGVGMRYPRPLYDMSMVEKGHAGNISYEEYEKPSCGDLFDIVQKFFHCAKDRAQR